SASHRPINSWLVRYRRRSGRMREWEFPLNDPRVGIQCKELQAICRKDRFRVRAKQARDGIGIANPGPPLRCPRVGVQYDDHAASRLDKDFLAAPRGPIDDLNTEDPVTPPVGRYISPPGQFQVQR